MAISEIHRVLEVNATETLVSFMGNETHARWVLRTDLEQQGFSDLVVDFLDSVQSTMSSATRASSLRFTISPTAMARLEGKWTHDDFQRKYHVGK